MADNTPRGRQKRVTQGNGVHRRGSGLGTGKVGSSQGPAAGSSGSSGGMRRAVTRGGLPGGLVLILLLVMLSGRCGVSGTSSQSGSSYTAQQSTDQSVFQQPSVAQQTQQAQQVQQAQTQQSTPQQPSFPTQSQQAAPSTQTAATYTGGGYSMADLASLFGGSGSVSSITGASSGWSIPDNTSRLNTSVSPKAREKYTKLLGGGNDTVTIMIYMCGTDLESKSGMATSDLSEMAKAAISDKVNILIYTGGCSGWRNNIMSSKVNQVYRLTNGGKFERLVPDDGSKVMTDPATLTAFINFCKKNFPASRNELIFWDHGGGSISGYGYDQKYPSAGAMSLAQINSALSKANMKFDFIGFDCCLMSTAENALMLSQYADYMIASEETEPGTGWYYTNWLSLLSQNTSVPTTELGKRIIDDFTDASAQKARGQSTTLALIDLAELQNTLPEKLAAFSVDTSELIKNDEYKTVATARSGAREFGAQARIDQVDLADLANRIGTDDAKELVDVIYSAVKYNRTSRNMANSAGLAIYFPSKRLSSVNTMVSQYQAIGMDANYAKTIQEVATMQASGQAASGGSASPFPMLDFGGLGGYGSSGSSSSYGSADLLTQLIGSMLSGGSTGGLGLQDLGFMSGSGLSDRAVAEYIEENHFDADQLFWNVGEDGLYTLTLPAEQWSMVDQLDLNMFYDDGEGYVDLGYDNVYEFTKDGSLIGNTDRTWLAINGDVVAYYHLDTTDDGDQYRITGRVPCLVNGERSDLILVFDNDEPYGYIAGVTTDYVNGETETAAKIQPGIQEQQSAETDSETGLTENIRGLTIGDRVDFLCDFYSYDGEYLDSYMIGDRWIVDGQPEISNVDVGSGAVRVLYHFTDMYGQEYWTPAIMQ